MTVAFFGSPALAAWMLYTMILGGLITLGTLAAHEALRASRQPIRWIWLAAIGVTVTLSIAAPFRELAVRAVSGSEVAAFDHGSANATVGAKKTEHNLVARIRDVALVPLQVTLQGVQRFVAGAPARVYRALAVFWLLLSATMTAAFLVSYRRIIRLVRQSDWTEIGGVLVRVTPNVGPVVAGFRPCQIVVPRWLTSRPLLEQQMAVAHEVEHIRAADPWVLFTGCAAVALFPWNPALWYCLSRLRLGVEIDCDRRVVLRGMSAEDYGSLLIDFSASRPSLALFAPAFPGSHTHLERRLIAMTEQPVRFSSARRIAGWLLAASVLITACESRLPTAADIEHMDATSAENQATANGLFGAPKTRLPEASGVTTRYFLNGNPVDAELAKAIDPAHIASITVAKSTGGTVNEIRISTLANVQLVAGTSTFGVNRVELHAPIHVGTPSNWLNFSGLLIVDGVVVKASDLAAMSPDRIASVEVIKGAAASSYTDPRAVNGVIIVTTKR